MRVDALGLMGQDLSGLFSPSSPWGAVGAGQASAAMQAAGETAAEAGGLAVAGAKWYFGDSIEEVIWNASLGMVGGILGKGLVKLGGKALGKFLGKYGDDVVETAAKYGDDACEGLAKTGKRFTPDKSALVELAKEGKKGVSMEDAKTLLEWAEEYGLKPALDHTKPPLHWKGPHIRIGPVNHIPVN
jgi:hypothetical protein